MGSTKKKNPNNKKQQQRKNKQKKTSKIPNEIILNFNFFLLLFCNCIMIKFQTESRRAIFGNLFYKLVHRTGQHTHAHFKYNFRITRIIQVFKDTYFYFKIFQNYSKLYFLWNVSRLGCIYTRARLDSNRRHNRRYFGK